MSTVKPKNKTIKYANGRKMIRCSFDMDKSIGEKFKRQLLRDGKTMASVFRPVIAEYMESKPPEL